MNMTFKELACEADEGNEYNFFKSRTVKVKEGFSNYVLYYKKNLLCRGGMKSEFLKTFVKGEPWEYELEMSQENETVPLD